MLSNPFSGKELFIQYEIEMGRINLSAVDEDSRQVYKDECWDAIGKQKKQAWNNLAKMINHRMDDEVTAIALMRPAQ